MSVGQWVGCRSDHNTYIVNVYYTFMLFWISKTQQQKGYHRNWLDKLDMAMAKVVKGILFILNLLKDAFAAGLGPGVKQYIRQQV